LFREFSESTASVSEGVITTFHGIHHCTDKVHYCGIARPRLLSEKFGKKGGGYDAKVASQ
jgi:hypothetical protein